MMNKGTTLLLSVLVLSIILTIALGVTTIFIGELRLSGGVSQSVTAFYAADTGIECFLYQERVNPALPCDGAGRFTVSGSLEFQNAQKLYDTDGRTAILRSSGIYNMVSRGLEVRYLERLP
ncbi:MAG: hypothetical protein Q8R13_03460 [bacterium]|nr:hypothetical protein [bacterium]MDZ4296275.1 hypothetical protein [Patescibacteria group bacterium]MDZ4296278.1 hypothetical protein [Patescibacteria group bacterium]